MGALRGEGLEMPRNTKRDTNSKRDTKPKRGTREVSLALCGHLAIGLGLGLLFAVALVFIIHSPILALIEADGSPRLALVVYIGTLAMTFGIGATLTGLLLETTDQA
jgi:hypothetical protein